MASVRSLRGTMAIEHRSISVRRLLAGLTTYWNAIREGGAAAHDYDALVRRGVPHDEAVVHVFEDHFGGRR